MLTVCVFNRSNAYSIYSFKVVSFTVPILCYYYAIRHFGSNILVDIFGIWSGSALLVVFAVVCDKAFKIPENIDRLKQLLALYIRQVNMPNRRKMEVLKRIKAIRAVGVEEGHFNTLERLSSPRILDFTIKNTCNLLVS